MATTPVTGTSNNAKTAPAKDRMQDLDVDQFLKLMIAELQNQDPLNPMDNAQMIQQISEIRSIASTDKLSSTLDGVQLGQALASASSLIGRTVSGLSEKNTEVNGKVDRVTVVAGVPKLHVGEDTIKLSSIRDILSSNGT
jgi:flagellar basal-body rod modification protein FlgD